MKNIKISLITICSILLLQGVMAQNYDYRDGRRFDYVNGVAGATYICYSKIPGGVILYNENNYLTFVNQKKMDGSKMLIHGDDYYDIPDSKLGMVYDIITSHLTVAERNRVKEPVLTVRLYIDSNTGKVREVNFHFLTDEGFATIAPATYYKIETELKSKFSVTMLPEGRKLNHNIYGFTYSYMPHW